MSDEEYARSVWANVWTNERTGEPRMGTFMFLNWSAAAEFTREHEERVRHLREEIALVRDSYQACFNIGKTLAFHDTTRGKMAAEALVWMRIIDRLEAELTRMTADMKEDVAPQKG